MNIVISELLIMLLHGRKGMASSSEKASKISIIGSGREHTRGSDRNRDSHPPYSTGGTVIGWTSEVLRKT